MEREIVILTESSKDGGLCVAGVDYNTGKWIRLEKKDGKPITKGIMQYADRTSVEILDCVRLNTIGSAATPIQPENVYIDTTKSLKMIKKLTMRELLEIHKLENHMTVLGNSSHVIKSNINSVGHSLELIRVNNATLHKVMGANGYYKTKMDFVYNNLHYHNMSVTDPDYFKIEDGTRLGEVILVISIPDDDYSKIHGYFKFVAKIFK